MDSFVIVSPGGHFHDACLGKSLVKSHQHIVVRFSDWNKWYNEQRFTHREIAVPVPAFVGDSYEIAKNVSEQLNQTQLEKDSK
jgi:hypothetical protein